MAATVTTLATALDALALDFNVTSSAGATVGGFARINGEFSVITGINGNKISVRSRGDNGGVAVAHAPLSPVTFGGPGDQANLGSTEVTPVPVDQNLASIGADGPIAVPLRNTTYFITKAAALGGGSTMPNPPASSDGLEVGFIALTTPAHVVTLVTSSDGTAGNSTTYTFPGAAGAGFRLMASKGAWVVLYNNLVVIT